MYTVLELVKERCFSNRLSAVDPSDIKLFLSEKGAREIPVAALPLAPDETLSEEVVRRLEGGAALPVPLYLTAVAGGAWVGAKVKGRGQERISHLFLTPSTLVQARPAVRLPPHLLRGRCCGEVTPL